MHNLLPARLLMALLFCVQLISLGLQAAEEDAAEFIAVGKSMRDAQIAFEAQQYGTARSLYQDLLQGELGGCSQIANISDSSSFPARSPLSERRSGGENNLESEALAICEHPLSWQTAIVRYNQALTLSKMAKWNAAAVQLKALNSTYALPKQLKARVSEQLAVALLEQARASSRNGSEENAEAVGLLKEALHIAQDDLQECCEALKASIEDELAKYLLLNDRQKLASISSYRQLAFLLSEAAYIEQLLQETAGADLDHKQMQPFLEQVYQSAQAGAAAWDLPVKLEPNATQLFLRLKEENHLAREGLIKKPIQASLTAFSDLNKVLQELLASMPPQPLQDSLKEAVQNFSNALEMHTLPPSQQHRLEEQLNALAGKADADQNGLRQIKAAQNTYQLALHSFKSGENSQAAYFLTAALQRLKRAHQDLSAQSKDEPRYYLETALAEQKNALELILAQEQYAKSAQPTSQMRDLPLHVQHAAGMAAEAFNTVALNWQKKWFESDNPAKQCQEKPWNEVFPLFYRGETAAITAEQLMQKAPLDLTVYHQKQAIDNWQAALTKLQNQTQSSSSSSSSQPPPPNQSGGGEKQNIEQVMQELVEMDQEDQPSKQPVGVKTVEKPW